MQCIGVKVKDVEVGEVQVTFLLIIYTVAHHRTEHSMSKNRNKPNRPAIVIWLIYLNL